MIPTPDLPKRVRGSVLVYTPYIWILTARPLGASIAVFAGDLPAIVIGIPLFLFSLLSWFVMGVRAVSLHRWKRLVAIIASGIIALTAAYFIRQFRVEIHFQVLCPFYDEQLSHEKDVTTEWWEWDSAWGYNEGVEYVKNPTLAPPSTDKDDGCTDTNQKLDSNFFFEFTSC